MIKHFLTLAILSFVTSGLFAQNGIDCSTAIPMPSGNPSCLNSNILSGSQLYFSFIATSSHVNIKIQNPTDTSLGHVHVGKLIDTCIVNDTTGAIGVIGTAVAIGAVNSPGSFADTLLEIDTTGLIIGRTYFIRVSHNVNSTICAICTVPNVPFGICVENFLGGANCTSAFNLGTISSSELFDFSTPPLQTDDWISFVPSTSVLKIDVTDVNTFLGSNSFALSPVPAPLAYFHSIEIYSGNCTNLTLESALDVDSIDSASGRRASLKISLINLISGNKYFIHLLRHSPQNNYSNFRISFMPVVLANNSCSTALDICGNAYFSLATSGIGNTVNGFCSISNPGPPHGNLSQCISINSPNGGCLEWGERAATWIHFKITQSGNLSFNLIYPLNYSGNGNVQTGEFDWSLFPYVGPNTCTLIGQNALGPVRCNFNGQGYDHGTGLLPALPNGNAVNYEPTLAVTCGEEFILCVSNWDFMSGYGLISFNQYGSFAHVGCIVPCASVVVTSDGPKCPGYPVTLTATVTGALSYNWVPGNFTTQSITINPTTATTYTVYVNTTSGQTSQVFVQTVLPAPQFTAGFCYSPICTTITYIPAQATICLGGSAYLFSNIFGPSTYTWTPANSGLNSYTSPFVTATPTATTVYTITVTNTSGCSTSESITVNVNPPPVIILTPSNVQCFGGNTGSIAVGFFITPTNPVHYSWSNGQTGQIATGLAAGCYTVVVTDGNGCTATSSACITQPTFFTGIANATPTLICNPGSSQLYAQGTGGTPPYTYNWQPSSDLNNPNIQNPTAFPTVNTVYTVTITDSHQCTATAVTTVSVFGSGLTVSINNESCVGNLFKFIPSISNATSYSWNFGDGSTSSGIIGFHNYQQPGIFTVSLTITGGPGCTFTISFQVNVTPAGVGGYNNPFNSSCCTNNFTYDVINYTIHDLNSYNNFLTLFPTSPSTPLYFRDTLIIDYPGFDAILANKIINFGPWGRVIIKQGSKLDLYNMVLTGLLPCETMWQGIEVWGTPSQTQSNANMPIYHGWLAMHSNSKIENAHIAVTLGWNCYLPPQPNCQICLSCADFGGGLVQADGNSEFNASGMDIKFLPYKFVNRSTIKSCHFNELNVAHGALLDPGYNSTLNSYQYPNPYNPYYSPANALHRTGREVYAYGVKQILFDDNIFFDCENGFELFNANARLIDANGNNLANQFNKMTTAFNASYFNSTIFGNLISRNNFTNIGGAHTIRIDAGKYDQIFANRLGFASTIFSTSGMILNNSTGYNITDNFLNSFPIGIAAINSGSNGGMIGYTSQGNIFTQCGRSTITFLNNQYLQIHCNQFINNGNINYSSNWSTSNQLADQGNFPYLNDHDAAGNKFDPFLTTGFRREITSSVSAFQYLRNNNSIVGDPTCVIPNLTLAPNVVLSNTLSSELSTSCDPCPAPCNNLINQLATRIGQLKIEHANKLASLDGNGNTSNLISAINSNMSNGNLKNLLLANSPLSDAVILATINRSSHLPSGIFKDILIPNSPVSTDVRPALYAYLSGLPSGISSQIKTAQLNFSNRTLAVISMELNSAINQQLLLINDAIAFNMRADTLIEDSTQTVAIQILQQQNTVANNQTLASTFILNGNINSANAVLNSLNPTNNDEQAFKDLQQILSDLTAQHRTVYSLSSSQLQFVNQLAQQSPNSLASVNACSILKLLFGTDCGLPDLTGNNTMRLMQDHENNSIESNSNQYLGKNYPNPFSNSTFIPYNLPMNSGGYIKVFDMNGKLMTQVLISEGENVAEIKTTDWNAGVYMYAIEIDGVQMEFAKMILIK